jgi:hypothetical protein
MKTDFSLRTPNSAGVDKLKSIATAFRQVHETLIDIVPEEELASTSLALNDAWLRAQNAICGLAKYQGASIAAAGGRS